MLTSLYDRPVDLATAKREDKNRNHLMINELHRIVKGEMNNVCCHCLRPYFRKNLDCRTHQSKCQEKQLEIDSLMHYFFTFDKRMFVCQLGCGFQTLGPLEMAKHFVSKYSDDKLLKWCISGSAIREAICKQKLKDRQLIALNSVKN